MMSDNRGSSASQPIFRPQFVVIAEHAADVGQRGPGPGVDLSGATGATMLASGRSRATRRMACRAWRSASAVTAHVLTITVSAGTDGQAAHNLAFVHVSDGSRR